MPNDLLLRETYHYDLPAGLIAQYPVPHRDESRLMHLKCHSQEIGHHVFRDLKALLHPGDVLVLNNSKVFPARLYGCKENGTRIQVLLLNPSPTPGNWQCLVQPGKRVRSDQWLTFSETLRGYLYAAEVDGMREIKLEHPGELFSELEQVGHMPLPPYIDRQDLASDRERYQTVYAEALGSVAAPTAGLHFTQNLIADLKAQGVIFTELTLHVGIGTFRPVKVDNILEHNMHSEAVEVSANTAQVINTAKAQGRRIITVGTTSTRSVEAFCEAGIMQSGMRWTDIFIYPGYQFQLTDAMITNFHLPESTLLMMVSAFAGYEFVRSAYAEAVAQSYRFFSYGDAMYIEL